MPDVNSIQARLVRQVDLSGERFLVRGMDQVNSAIARGLDDGAKGAGLRAKVRSRYGAFDLCQGA